MASVKKFNGTGKRKSAAARVILSPGDGQFTINGREGLDNYFGRATSRMVILQPFEVTGNLGKFNVQATLTGGGPQGQAGALRHGISRALLAMNPDYRKPLRKAGFLTRDARVKERKKYGLRGARKATQYSKR
ncbi:30S ribosomal protein S9 [Deltaproteobacteria bacterium PRO3]|jgi:small subunit ribosomal protein S9|nr:30S ribosomal protein S9 [Deltaproteobacteria bacterium PRO3]